MKSRTSFCNVAVLKRTLIKGLPLWGTYLLAWLTALPIILYSSDRWDTAMELREYILSLAVFSSQIVGALYGLAAAGMVFLYLYKSRTANFFASLPLTRGQLFRTNFLAGILYAVVPNLIVVLFSVPAALAWETFLVKDLLSWFVIMTLVYLFYYSFAVMLAMVVSNLMALALLYGVLNFTAAVLEAIIRSLMSHFVYGYSYRGGMLLSWASPLYYTLFEGNGMDVIANWDNVAMINTDYYITGWSMVWIMGAVSLVFLAAAYVIHHCRRMESAGDVIAVNHLKPVFLYCFTVGCSIVLGFLLAELLLESNIHSVDFIPVLICMLLGSFVGYFSGQMMLQKSLLVFRKRNWCNWAVVGVVIAAVMLCVRLDVLGYASYVPKAEEVQRVSVMHDVDNGYTADPELVDQILALHEDCVANQAEIEYWESRGILARMYIDYELTDGRKLSREYIAPMGLTISDDLVRQYEAIINDPDYKVHRLLPAEYMAKDILSCSIINYRTETEKYLSSKEAYDFLKNYLEPDLRESSMEERRWIAEPTMEEITISASGEAVAIKETVREEDTSINIHIEFDRTVTSDGKRSRFCYFSVPFDAERVIAYATELGVEPWVKE